MLRTLFRPIHAICNPCVVSLAQFVYIAVLALGPKSLEIRLSRGMLPRRSPVYYRLVVSCGI